MTDAILTLNAGSSSLKFALFAQTGAVLRGEVEGIGATPRVRARDRDGARLAPPDVAGSTHEDLFAPLLGWLHGHLGGGRIRAAGHRVVHGGERFADPVLVDADVLAALEALVPLAPLHQPHSLAAIRAVSGADPGLPQVACFDTAFHRTMPEVATRLALPREYTSGGLRRYGFHGLSYEFVARRLRELAPDLARGRVIAAHLGSGASLCALLDGRSVETTMGFSALDGLVMGTRPGCLDAGAVLHLIQERNLDPEALEDLLYNRSGLLGVSGLSGDMRVLQASAAPAAREAIELFTYRVAGEAGRLVAALGGLDGFVFTAGIGEHDAGLRAAVCRRLGWLGAVLDSAANAAGPGCVSPVGCRVQVWVIPTDEEAMIARHTSALVAPDPDGMMAPV